ncbi:hypothetical protein [Pontibacter rugosus]|uniref:Cyclic nucleotide-binding domain-containing protein n=1 Tax=Pontibacter rugosus TaxID=1745966 RepID=A0ABW3SLR9_9BACT
MLTLRQQFKYARRQQASSFDLLQDLVNIRYSQRETDYLALVLRYQAKIWVHDQFEVLGHIVKLLRRHRHEAQVLVPGGVVDLPQFLCFLLIVFQANGPDGNSFLLQPRPDYLRQPVRLIVVTIGPKLVGQQVHLLLKAQVFQQRYVIRVIVGHHGRRRTVKSFHQHAAGFVGREVNRPNHRFSPFCIQPLAHLLKKQVCHFPILHAVKESEEAILCIVKGIMVVVEDGGNPSYNISILVGQVQLQRRVLMEGMFPRREQVFLRNIKLRHVMRVVLVQRMRKVNKGF